MSHFFRGIFLSSLLFTQFIGSAQSPLLPRDPSISGPQTFAIIMGVSKYKYVKPLAFADKDAIRTYFELDFAADTAFFE